ncbi:cysteine proteinase [Trichodelitschia bisporula]|uniref:Ubiquitin carboxyl-terminal hydrolase n=1 Tax=Trichodelitschia bisporula TaxID=703511 RepID=A0A6G1HX93_9PEZI|nr:cysteine proteinase [Trichodelitschia bisporula]
MARPSIPTPPVMSPTPPQDAPSTPSAASQMQHSPSTPAISTTTNTSSPPPTTEKAAEEDVTPPQPITSTFVPPLPWYSRPSEPFFVPQRCRHDKGKRYPIVAIPFQRRAAHEIPRFGQVEPVEQQSEEQIEDQEPLEPSETEEHAESQTSTLAAQSDAGTPATSEAPSEVDSTSSAAQMSSQPVTSKHVRTATRPVIPILPAKPKAAAAAAQKPAAAHVKDVEPPTAAVVSPPQDIPQPEATAASEEQEPEVAPTTAAKPAPKSWAELVRSKNAAQPAVVLSTQNGTEAADSIPSKAASLAEAIRAFSVGSNDKVSFLEPRGLVNTGNMCYMNSILQSLVFCLPFHDFLDLVGKRAAHSFKSETPLLDAMILFMREFQVIDSAASVDKLKLRLKSNELEQFGDAFIPEYVYDATKRLPRFAAMKRGHQQDAEEFLGFLLEGLHDECAQVLKALPSSEESSAVASPVSEKATIGDNGWLEVGPKQKAAITRSSGHVVTDSPISKIFGGKLRSEFRVPGLKNSVTLEPYQPLQLDIGAPDVHNIMDALKNLTRPETIQGDFNSPRGPGVSATKQVFIETLPPVLILHLKRFQYDNKGGTQKIWKKVGYPLDLEVPKEVFPPHKRSGFAISGLPKYSLNGVVYHHGKNASGGHYTVDVRRQDGREWIRMDDTIIRRVRQEDVAQDGAEEDPKVLAKVVERLDKTTANIYDQIDDVESEQGEQGGWSQVSGAGKDGPSKKWSAVANGTSTPNSGGGRTPVRDGGMKDNKVAYILFYRRID